MDKYFRVEKPVPHKQHPSKPPLPQKSSPSGKSSPSSKPSSPKKTPRLKEWSDVVSDQAANIDIATLSDNELEQVLRLFDLNPAYGPFVGIDREFRWLRAETSGLKPPLLIKRIIDSGRVVQQREAGQLW